jgi:hypothetical protein
MLRTLRRPGQSHGRTLLLATMDRYSGRVKARSSSGASKGRPHPSQSLKTRPRSTVEGFSRLRSHTLVRRNHAHCKWMCRKARRLRCIAEATDIEAASVPAYPKLEAFPISKVTNPLGKMCWHDPVVGEVGHSTKLAATILSAPLWKLE